MAMGMLLAGCSDEQERPVLTPSQMELVGRGVNFSVSHAEPFTTRTTLRHDGSFNEGDIMCIYRQYSDDGGITFYAGTEAYRVYALTTKYITGTSFALETDWRPVEGAIGHNPNTSEYPADKRGDFIQTDADSLTWENGKTVRFRSWTRSNLAGAYDYCGSDDATANKRRYYPDYCVSEWVTVSGPTLDVPLTLKHQGCRIAFTTKAGNELYMAEICTEPEDYMWKDNADTEEHDESDMEHGKTLEEATAEANAVKAIYDRMCMPAGVDVERALLTTMTKELYDNSTEFKTIHTKTTADGIVLFDTKDENYIANSVQRPLFCATDGRLYMITIPYDMSTEHEGETLTLPPFTRFKIWLFDVNNGDKEATPNTEAQYHIFSLSDVMNKESGEGKERLFPNGMELKAGYSYRFSVGYYYDRFTITPADDFSWDTQDEENGDGLPAQAAQPDPDTFNYEWWTTAIKNAIPQSSSQIFAPEFHITDHRQFLEFIHLVNGTAVNDYVKANPMVHIRRPEKNYNKLNPELPSDKRWYYATDVVGGQVVAGADSVTHEEALEKGYILYQHYHPANADQSAYSEEDYVSAPFSFFDENLNRRFVVYLDNDLDLYDWLLTPIGDENVALTDAGSHPFRGIFDGYNATTNHIATLKNAYFRDGYMFRHCYDAAIRNLRIETTHDFMLVETAQAKDESVGFGAYIVGISIYAPSSGNPIAKTLTGSSYVVGCFYEGWAGGAMVGTANNLNMYGNMMVGKGLAHNTGALLGKYADDNQRFFAPQSTKKVTWGRFMGNYYLMDRYEVLNSQGKQPNVVHAVDTIVDKYRPQEYIRGGLSWVLKQKSDNLLSPDVPYERLSTELMRKGYYGLAPWKAMNYAIKRYNDVGAEVRESHNCKGHFVNNSDGYSHTYPYMVAGEPNSEYDATGYRGNYDSLNFMELNN